MTAADPMPSAERPTPGEHPPHRCGSVQCARCYNLTDPTKPLYRDRKADETEWWHEPDAH